MLVHVGKIVFLLGLLLIFQEACFAGLNCFEVFQDIGKALDQSGAI